MAVYLVLSLCLAVYTSPWVSGQGRLNNNPVTDADRESLDVTGEPQTETTGDPVTLSDIHASLKAMDPGTCYNTARIVHQLDIGVTICICYPDFCDVTISPNAADVKKIYTLDELDIFKLVVSVVTMFVGLPGNLLVMVTIVKFMKKTVTNMFIFNLALCYFIFLLFCGAVKIHESAIYVMEDIGDGGCGVLHYSYILFFYATSFTLSAMAWERYIAICKPMKSQGMNTYSRARKIIAIIWILAAIFPLPQFWRYLYNEYEDTCWEGYKDYQWINIFYYGLIFVVGFVVPFSVVIFSYSRTTMVLLKSIKEARKLKGMSAGKENEDPQGRLAVVKMLIVVVVLFGVCWLPWGLNQFVSSLLVYLNKFVLKNVTGFEQAFQYKLLSAVFLQLTYINSCLNPILYAIGSKQFNQGFRRCLSACFHLKLADDLRDTSQSSSAMKTGVSMVSVSENPAMATTNKL